MCYSAMYMVMCTDVCSVLQCTVYGNVYSVCVQCYSPQYMVMFTVDLCSVLQCTIYVDVYSGCAQCVTVHSIC